MPLLDHFRPPLSTRRHWESFFGGWASTIATALNRSLLPEGFFAEEHVHIGPRPEIDVTAFAEAPGDALLTQVAPPVDAVIPAGFPDTFNVQVFGGEGDARLVAAIELVSPANKDRADKRRAFAIKCASYLAQGVSLVLLDIVTNRNANLHDDIVTALGRPEACWSSASGLYATAYRPIVRGGDELIDLWVAQLGVSEALPTMPLALNAEIVLPVDLEATYTDARERRRLPA